MDRSNYNFPDPQMIFEIDEFEKDGNSDFNFSKHILPSPVKPSLTHFFISQLAPKKKLLRNYTQSLDGLEHQAGLKN